MLKHENGASARVTIGYDETEIKLLIEDDGCAAATPGDAGPAGHGPRWHAGTGCALRGPHPGRARARHRISRSE